MWGARLAASGPLLAILLLGGAGAAAGSAGICVPLVISRAGQPTVEQALRVAPGSTGLAALESRHSVRQDDGLVCAIDGYPTSGCTSVTPTGDIYWAYWHRAPGATQWTYSQVGSGTSIVEPGVAEGWSWQNGSSEAPIPPPDVDVALLCPATTPTPTPSPSNRPTHSPTPATTTGSSAPLRSPTPTTSRTAARPSVSPRSTTSDPPTSPTPARSSPQAATRSGGAASRFPWAVVAIAVVIAGLATAAVVRARRTG